MQRGASRRAVDAKKEFLKQNSLSAATKGATLRILRLRPPPRQHPDAGRP